MSFSGEMKEEIARLIPMQEADVRAELSAIIRFCGRIIRLEDSVAVLVETENVALAKTFVKLIKKAFDRAFEKYDVILGPAAPTTAPKLGNSLSDPIKMYLGDIYTISVNLAGLPGISVPCGVDSKGLPIGMQLIGDCFKENNIIRAAYAYEQTRTYERCEAAKEQD